MAARHMIGTWLLKPINLHAVLRLPLCDTHQPTGNVQTSAQPSLKTN